MGLNLSAAVLISLLMIPPIYLAIVRLLGPSNDLEQTLLRLALTELIAFTFSLIMVFHFKIKAKLPVGQD